MDKFDKIQLRIWKTKDNREIMISEMKDTHLINTAKMLHRKGFITPSIFEFYMSCDGPEGEQAQYAFQHECDVILQKPVSRRLQWVEEEIKKRGVKWDT